MFSFLSSNFDWLKREEYRMHQDLLYMPWPPVHYMCQRSDISETWCSPCKGYMAYPLLFPSTNSQKQEWEPYPTSSIFLPHRNPNHTQTNFSAKATIAALQNWVSNWFILLYLCTSIIQDANKPMWPWKFQWPWFRLLYVLMYRVLSRSFIWELTTKKKSLGLNLISRITTEWIYNPTLIIVNASSEKPEERGIIIPISDVRKRYSEDTHLDELGLQATSPESQSST